MTTVLTLDTLASQYALLKTQKDAIEAQLEAVKTIILQQVKPGQLVSETPEYKVICNPGRQSVVWTCDKDEQKALQNHLIEKGKMDIKIGDPYIQIRFRKTVD